MNASSRLATYHDHTRAIGPSVALVAPLLVLHELLVLILDPPVRNSAEQAVLRFVGRLPADVVMLSRYAILWGLVATSLVWWRRRQQASPIVLLEAALLAVLLGPLVGGMVGGLGLSAGTPWGTAGAPAWQPYLLSLGAGVWEELVFRLGLLGGLTVLLRRVTGCPTGPATATAVVLSALVFAAYHHIGAGGEELQLGRFAFRTLAGTILGVLFVARGLAVVVYMHVFYDLMCDLRLALS